MAGVAGSGAGLGDAVLELPRSSIPAPVGPPQRPVSCTACHHQKSRSSWRSARRMAFGPTASGSAHPAPAPQGMVEQGTVSRADQYCCRRGSGVWEVWGCYQADWHVGWRRQLQMLQPRQRGPGRQGPATGCCAKVLCGWHGMCPLVPEAALHPLWPSGARAWMSLGTLAMGSGCHTMGGQHFFGLTVKKCKNAKKIRKPSPGCKWSNCSEFNQEFEYANPTLLNFSSKNLEDLQNLSRGVLENSFALGKSTSQRNASEDMGTVFCRPSVL